MPCDPTAGAAQAPSPHRATGRLLSSRRSGRFLCEPRPHRPTGPTSDGQPRIERALISIRVRLVPCQPPTVTRCCSPTCWARHGADEKGATVVLNRPCDPARVGLRPADANERCNSRIRALPRLNLRSCGHLVVLSCHLRKDISAAGGLIAAVAARDIHIDLLAVTETDGGTPGDLSATPSGFSGDAPPATSPTDGSVSGTAVETRSTWARERSKTPVTLSRRSARSSASPPHPPMPSGTRAMTPRSRSRPRCRWPLGRHREPRLPTRLLG